MTAPFGQMKGAAIRELVVYYMREHEPSIIRAVAQAIPEDFGAELDPSVEGLGILASRWYDVRVCHLLLDATVARHPKAERDPFLRSMMQKSVRMSARGVYAFAIRQMVTPTFYARNIQRLWRMLHDSGDRTIQVEGTTAVSRTAHWKGHHPLLCRLNQHTMATLLEMMGCKNVSFVCRSCVSEHGGSECVYLHSWTS